VAPARRAPAAERQSEFMRNLQNSQE
jgi:hypothetical protein